MHANDLRSTALQEDSIGSLGLSCRNPGLFESSLVLCKKKIINHEIDCLFHTLDGQVNKVKSCKNIMMNNIWSQHLHLGYRTPAIALWLIFYWVWFHIVTPNKKDLVLLLPEWPWVPCGKRDEMSFFLNIRSLWCSHKHASKLGPFQRSLWHQTLK